MRLHQFKPASGNRVASGPGSESRRPPGFGRTYHPLQETGRHKVSCVVEVPRRAPTCKRVSRAAALQPANGAASGGGAISGRRLSRVADGGRRGAAVPRGVLPVGERLLTDWRTENELGLPEFQTSNYHPVTVSRDILAHNSSRLSDGV